MNRRLSELNQYVIENEPNTQTNYMQLTEFSATSDTYNVTSLSDRPIGQNQIQPEHNFQIRFFHKPILCLHCHDYIWGAGYIGYGCLRCAECVHFKCLIFTAKATVCANTPDTSLSLLEKNTKPNLYPIENWSSDLVKQWLAVVNLHRYAEVFSKYNITGSKLIMLNSEQLNEYRIRDSYHQKAILECCKELVVRSRQYSSLVQMSREQNDFSQNHLKANPYKASKHHFLLHTLSVQTNCHSCLRPLLGIVHQALICQQCGIMVHRQCSSTGLPNCHASNGGRNIKHYLFGVSLFDLASDGDNQSSQGVPLLLVKAFRHIEERASQSGEDLYDAYRLSADTAKIDQIKQQLNENGIELTRFERYDLNTICAIIKAFLRDLQNSVISEEIYTLLVGNISVISSIDLCNLIRTQLHPQHFFCLKFIMAHLIRVWSFQFRIRGCHYLPDKIFHIFRSILMRPAWENITEIVNNIDKQTLVIQRLMLECDWGEELPEYKIRPRRPETPLKSEGSGEVKVGSEPSSTLVQLIASKLKPGSGGSKNQTNLKIRGGELKQQNIIDNQEWFWANIVNRDNTNLILKSCPDGSFIVRNSTDKNPLAPYTLCVMKGTFVKSIKIFKQQTDENHGTSYYDIEKPCRFESVQSLIDYYSRVSLKEYNHNLDLKLTYGVSKFKFGRASEWSIDKLYSSFKEALDKYEILTKNCDNLELDLSIIREDITQKRVACEAFDKIIVMFETQLKQANSLLTQSILKKSNAVSASALLVSQFMPSKSVETTGEVEGIREANKVKLEEKLVKLREKRQEIVDSIDYLNLNLSELQEKLDAQRPELIELRKKRENYHMWLLQRGENEEKIQTEIDPVRTGDSSKTNKDEPTRYSSPTANIYAKNSSNGSCDLDDSSKSREASVELLTRQAETVKQPLFRTNSSSMLHYDSVNWYRADFTRELAEETLKNKPVGTYLVRTSNYASSKYVLSVVSQLNQTVHILIDEVQNKLFLKSQNNQRKLLKGEEKSASSDNCSVLTSSSTSMSSSSDYTLNLKREMNVNKFDTLIDLVVFYSRNMLNIGNKTWNIILQTPAFSDKIQITTF